MRPSESCPTNEDYEILIVIINISYEHYIILLTLEQANSIHMKTTAAVAMTAKKIKFVLIRHVTVATRMLIAITFKHILIEMASACYNRITYIEYIFTVSRFIGVILTVSVFQSLIFTYKIFVFCF